MPIFKEDIQPKTSAAHCPSNKWGRKINPMTGIIDFTETSININSESGNTNETYTSEIVTMNEISSYSYEQINVDGENATEFRDIIHIPSCEDNFYEDDSANGCCYIEESELKNQCREDHSTGLSYKKEGKIYNICHKEPIEQLFDRFFEDPNKIAQFFKLIFIWSFTLLITGIIGTCYEFWLRYGYSPSCIYYKTICKYNKNHKGTENKLSIIDFHFPNRLGYYPYQECGGAERMRGGSNKMYGGLIENEKIESNFLKFDGRCITVDFMDDAGGKIFPYNLVDIADDNINSGIIKTIVRGFVFFFLFSTYFTRIVVNGILKKISILYQKIVKNNYTLSNVIFLILTGLIFPILAYNSGNLETNSGVGWLLFILLLIISFMTSIIPIYTLLVVLIPSDILKNKPGIKPSYYFIKGGDYFYSFKYPFIKNLKHNIFTILKNIFIIPLLLIMINLTMIAAGAGSIFSMLYLQFSTLFKFFYVPLSNPLESLNILKNHADLLTILFCIGVIGSSAKSFNPNTTGIMSIILAIIIFFKVSGGLYKSV